MKALATKVTGFALAFALAATFGMQGMLMAVYFGMIATALAAAAHHLSS